MAACPAAVSSSRQTSGRNEAIRPHRRTTARTGQWRTCTSEAHGDRDFQEPLHAKQLLARIAVEEAVITHTTEPRGQHVLDDQPHEARTADGSGHPLSALAVAVGERHRLAVVGDQLLLADDATIEIARQVLQRRLPGADPAAVHDPAFRQRRRRREAGDSQAVEHPSAEDRRERLVREQIPSLRRSPTLPARVDRAAGDDHVHVRVVVEAPRLGVQHRAQSDLAVEVLVAMGEVAAGAHRAVEQQPVEHLGVVPSERATLGRQGERHEVVAHRQELGLLALEPAGVVVVLATRAAAVSAGAEHRAGVLA